jgi:hypothetical protein
MRCVNLADAVLTAIHDNYLSGDKCSIIACQKQIAPETSSGSPMRLMACCSQVARFCSSD